MGRGFHFFGLGLSLFCLGFCLYAAWWLIRRLELGSLGRLLALEAALLAGAFYPAARTAAASFSGPAADALLAAGFFVLGASFIVFWTLALADLLLAAAARLGAGRGALRAGAAAALGAAFALIGLALAEGTRPPEPRLMELEVKGLPGALDGFTVLQVSDLHLGRLAGLDRLLAVSAAAEALSPDLVVFTGDFSERREPMPAGACAALAAMKAARGKAAVLGNHDMFAGGGAPAAEFFRGCGVKVLRGDVYEAAPGLLVAGVDDLKRGGAPQVEALAAALDRSKPLIFLSHQPGGFGAVTARGSGLALSGHTHGGQIFPFGLLERGLFEYFQGLYRAGGFRVYVTSGAGVWGPPLRLFTRSELPVFRLRAAPPSAEEK